MKWLNSLSVAQRNSILEWARGWGHGAKADKDKMREQAQQRLELGCREERQ
jgi:hypothetical protein